MRKLGFAIKHLFLSFVNPGACLTLATQWFFTDLLFAPQERRLLVERRQVVIVLDLFRMPRELRDYGVCVNSEESEAESRRPRV